MSIRGEKPSDIDDKGRVRNVLCLFIIISKSLPVNKVISGNIILENLFAFDATANYVVKGSCRVNPYITCHLKNYWPVIK